MRKTRFFFDASESNRTETTDTMELIGNTNEERTHDAQGQRPATCSAQIQEW